MRIWSVRFAKPFALVAIVLCFSGPPARAQSVGLGGYGAMTAAASASMGGGAIIPYGGSLSGFMPVRMGGGSMGLSFWRGAHRPCGLCARCFGCHR